MRLELHWSQVESVTAVGAVPEERYRLLLEWLLAGESGGLIALDRDASETGATGHSPIGHQLRCRRPVV
jgi:hypothetical protein